MGREKLLQQLINQLTNCLNSDASDVSTCLFRLKKVQNLKIFNLSSSCCCCITARNISQPHRRRYDTTVVLPSCCRDAMMIYEKTCQTFRCVQEILEKIIWFWERRACRNPDTTEAAQASWVEVSECASSSLELAAAAGSALHCAVFKKSPPEGRGERCSELRSDAFSLLDILGQLEEERLVSALCVNALFVVQARVSACGLRARAFSLTPPDVRDPPYKPS